MRISHDIYLQTFAGVVCAEGIGLKYSNAVPAPPASVVSSSSLSCPTVSVGFGVLAARGVNNVALGVPRLPPLPGVLKKRCIQHEENTCWILSFAVNN